MATRNLVPRGNNEGSLGISTRRWSALHVASVSTDELKVGDNLPLFTNGVGISSITANNDGQFVISMTSAFLEDLGFTTAGGINSGFTRNDGNALTGDDSIASGDSLKTAIQKLNDDVRGVAVPTTLTVANFSEAAILAAGEAFVDGDNHLMTSAAINDRIESFGYTTNTGDITRISTGTGLDLSGGDGLSGDVTIKLSNIDTVSAGSYGSVSAIPSIIVDAQGRITAASNTNLSGISVTSFSDVSNAGSGSIITANERTKLADATDANTASKLVIRDGSGDFAANEITATLKGNADTATSAGKWTSAATLTLAGDLSGSVDIDGSAGVTLNATVISNSVTLGTDTTGDYVSTITAGTGLTSTGATSGEGIAHAIAVDGVLEDLDTLGAASNDGEFIVATEAGAFAYESGATVRTSLGLGSGDSPSFAGLTSTDNVLIDNQKELRLGEANNGTDYVAIKSPAVLGASYTLTLPVDDGTENFVLITDGSGGLSWSAVTGASGSTNSFSTVSVAGQTDLEADTASDTLTIASGSGISLTTTAGTDTLTITASGIATGQLAANAGIVDTQLATISTADKVSLTALDIDDAADIGADLADADLIIIDDNAAGANRKSTLSRVATYINDHSSITTLSSLASVGAEGSTLTAEGSLQVDQNLTITGTLTVNGDQFKVDGTTVQLDDNLIEMGLVSNAAPTSQVQKDLGLLLHDHGAAENSATIHSFYWDNSDSKFRLESGVSEDGNGILSGGSSADLVVGALEASSLSLTTDLAVAQGGTGASSLTDHGVLVGSGTNPITTLAVGSNGQLLIGSDGADPVFADLTAGNGLTSTTGAGALTLAVDLKANGGLVIESEKLAIDLEASSITGTLAVADGGTGQASLSDIVNASNGGITVTDGADSVIGGNVSLSLNLVNLAEAVVDVANDSIAIIDAGDNSSKRESIVDFMDKVKGAGLAASSGSLVLDLSNSIPNVGVGSGDKFLMLDSDGSTEQLETIDNLGTYLAGNGLTSSTGILALDLNELTAAPVDVATDSIAIIDATDDSTKKEAIADIITAIAGNGLSVTNGVLAASVGGGLDIDSNTIRIAASAAGNGLTGGAGSALALDLNELTEAPVDVSTDSIAIIDATDDSTKKESIGDLITAVAGNGLSAAGGVLAVSVDGSGIELNNDTLRLKNSGVTLAKLDNLDNMKVIGNTSGNSATPTAIDILDQDNLAGGGGDGGAGSATSLATQQSIKKYVDDQITAQDLDFQGDSGGALSIDLDSEVLDIAGGTGIDTVGASNTLTVSIDSTVATLTGNQTLTNKTISEDDNDIRNLTTTSIHADTLVLKDADSNGEGIASHDNDTTLPTSAAVKQYVDDQLGRHGGIFRTDSSDNSYGQDVQYNRDVIFDSSPLVRSHFGPFGFDLGQLVDESGSDLTFFGSTATQASDRHFLVVGSTSGNDTKGDCKFTGASFIEGNDQFQTP